MRGKKVLVIEDDYDVTLVLSTVLQGAGFEVATARDGHSALSVAKHHRPDLITLDMGMPGQGGAAVLDQIRAEPTLITTPVIVITGSGLIDKNLALAQGAQAYLQKPFEPDELVQEATRLVSPA